MSRRNAVRRSLGLESLGDRVCLSSFGVVAADGASGQDHVADVAELFGVMRESMPEDNPGTLPAQEYGDVVAYFLQLNKFPTGADELVGSDEAMAAILFEKPK